MRLGSDSKNRPTRTLKPSKISGRVSSSSVPSLRGASSELKT